MKSSNLILIFFPTFLLFDLVPVSAGLKVFECSNKCQVQKRESSFFDLSSKNNKYESVDTARKENNLNKLMNRSIHKIFLRDYEFNKSILNILLSENNNDLREDRKFTEFEIESDTQYNINDTFYAEGDVEVLFENSILRADKIEFDKTKSLLKVQGNIKFYKGTQFFEADYFEYNFRENKGLINNIYGFIDFDNFSKNFNLKDIEVEDKSCISSQEDILNLPSQVTLQGSSNLGLKRKLALDSFTFNFSKIKKWRFKSEKIILGKDNFSSDLILFTNDPFNKPQFILKSKNFSGEVINQKIQFKSKSTFLNIDDKFTLLMGGTTIKDSDAKASFGIGYDGKDKDGFYLKKSYSLFDDVDKYSLDIQQYFLLQRTLKGSSNAFREKGSSFFSDNVISDINFLDYFAISATLNSKLGGWNLNKSINLKTLNPEKFYDGISTKFNLVKNLYNKSEFNSNRFNKKNKCDVYLKSNEKLDFSINFGLYGTYDEGDIHSAYGSKLFTNLSSKKGNLEKKYEFVFDVGKYKGKNKDNSKLISNERYGIISSLYHEYQFFKLNQNNYNEEYRFTPELIKQGIFLKTYINAGLYHYSDSSNQSIISLGLGPSLVYGESKRKFIDYTYISIYPKFVQKTGESPFTFDQFNKDSTIEFDIEQQIFGPLIFGYNGILTIDKGSDNSGRFETKNLKLAINRRAYSIEASYSPKEKTSFLGFNVYAFDYKNISPKF